MKKITTINQEERELIASLEKHGLGMDLNEQNAKTSFTSAAAGTAAGAFLLFNLGVLLSLPPVLMGRGAPYLPTFRKSADAMFQQLRKQPHIMRKVEAGEKLRFVDLGSGDGRLVFQASREGLFHQSVGYEINPMLYATAQANRLFFAPRYWTKTEFYLRDIWKVNLEDVDVVAVYGLNPIMEELGSKLKRELKPGSVVLSNVFAIPGWRSSGLSQHKTHVYVVPDPEDNLATSYEHPAEATSGYSSPRILKNVGTGIVLENMYQEDAIIPLSTGSASRQLRICAAPVGLLTSTTASMLLNLETSRRQGRTTRGVGAVEIP